MTDAERVDDIFSRFNRDFEGSFHSALWQLIVNKAHEEEHIAFVPTTGDGEGFSLSLAFESGGYLPLVAWFKTNDYHKASTIADLLSAQVFGITSKQVHEITTRSMRESIT